MLKIGFVSLGCAKNQVDFERIAGSLYGKFEFVNTPEDCDFMIINTCGFIQEAVTEAIENILEMKSRLAEHAKLIVFGCMSERYKDEFAAELPEVDFFAGVGEDEVNKVMEFIGAEKIDFHNSKRYLLNPSYYAYLKIAEGCDNRCAYCSIPSIRGKHISVNLESIINEADKLVSSGIKELIVISQDTGKYGSDLNTGEDLAFLMDVLAKKYTDVYFRLMYLNPDGITEKLLQIMQQHDNIIKYFDIPVQHGSDRILKLMRRKSNRKQIEEIFTMIRSYFPNAFIRTTLIVGFPGETEDDFKNNVTLLESLKPDFAGFFPYSREKGTPAYDMDNNIDMKTIKKRLLILQKIQKKNTLQRLNSLKDSFECFIEKHNEDFEFILEGRALFQAPEIDGLLYLTDSESINGAGPFKVKINRVAYPDIYVSQVL